MLKLFNRVSINNSHSKISHENMLDLIDATSKVANLADSLSVKKADIIEATIYKRLSKDFKSSPEYSLAKSFVFYVSINSKKDSLRMKIRNAVYNNYEIDFDEEQTGVYGLRSTIIADDVCTIPFKYKSLADTFRILEDRGYVLADCHSILYREEYHADLIICLNNTKN